MWLIQALTTHNPPAPHISSPLQEFLQELGSDIRRWRSVVLTCKIKSAWTKGTDKLFFQLASSHAQTQLLVVQGLELLGCEQKHGPAPKGNLERQVQRVLDQLKD
mmetsp:Transcript_27354/g.41343  ORF Transcript_27354/g.41343 Transcript_27354/m.41343 type:complete len:105 (+) Transcript_27354:63-377(+)